MSDMLLNFLSEYLEQPKVVTLSELSIGERERLPPIWRNVLERDDEKLERILHNWSFIKDELALVYDYLCENLVSLDLTYFNDEYHLIYGIKSAQGETLYYQGTNPKFSNQNDYLSRMPNKLKQFYNLHNGWFYLASGSMGISPLDELFRLDEYEWEIEQNSDFKSLALDLNRFISIFSNGMGAHIAFDEQLGEFKSIIWWSNDMPTMDIEFWPTLDTWIRLGFDDD